MRHPRTLAFTPPNDGREHDAQCWSKPGHHECAIARVRQLRWTSVRLNRRCSGMQGALTKRIQDQRELAQSRTLGRALANSAACMYSDRIDRACAILVEAIGNTDEVHHLGCADDTECTCGALILRDVLNALTQPR